MFFSNTDFNKNTCNLQLLLLKYMQNGGNCIKDAVAKLLFKKVDKRTRIN